MRKNMKIIFSFFLLAILGHLLQTVSYSQQSTRAFDNSFYETELLGRDGVTVFFIHGFNHSKADGSRIPSRRMTIPCDDGNCTSYRVENVKYALPVSATPYYYVEYSLTKDSAVLETVHPWLDASVAPNESDIVARNSIQRNGRIISVVVEVPLLSYDRATNTVRFVESFDLVPVTEQNLLNRVQLPARAEYISQPFIRRSKDLDTSGAWLLFDRPSLRFFIRTDGMYKIDRNWFSASGLNPDTYDPRNFKLYRKGLEIPMYQEGTEDGTLDPGDSFVFVGEMNYDEAGYRFIRKGAERDEPHPQFLNKYSDSTAYWLVFSDSPGQRIAPTAYSGTPPVDTLDWYYHLIHSENDAHLFHLTSNVDRAQFSDWTSEDTWISGWLWQTNAAVTNVATPNLKPGQPARVWYKAASWYGNAAVSPNHKLSLSMNFGPIVDSLYFNVNEQALLSGVVPDTALRPDQNTIRLQSEIAQPPGYGDTDCVVDWFDVEYPRSMSAQSNRLSFPIDSVVSQGPKFLNVTGFQNQEVLVLKQSPTGWAALTSITATGSGPYGIVVPDSIRWGSKYHFAAKSALLPTPAPVVVQVMNTRTQQEADYLIVTTKEFGTSPQEYAAFIESEYGVATRILYVEDIYDNYSFGIFNPEALKVFLYDAVNSWTSKPLKYLLLLGDANYNYKRPNSAYSKNFVPTYGFPSGDMWFACFDERAIDPVFSVGRLPMRQSGDIQRYLERHRKYRSAKPTLWNKTSMHFSGGFPKDGEAKLAFYRSINQELIGTVITPPPLSGTGIHFYKTISPLTDFGPYSPKYIKQAINEGAILISYVGHSGTETWDNSIVDASQLANTVDRSPVISDFGCSTAKFAEPDITSFSEHFVVNQGGQAIAYVGNSSLGYESTSARLPKEFIGRLITENIRNVGDAHRLAKKALIDRYGSSTTNMVAMRSNVVIGDPIVEIPLPRKTNLVAKTEWIVPEKDILTDAMDSVSFQITFQNQGLYFSDTIRVLVEEVVGGNVKATAAFQLPVPTVNHTFSVTLPTRNEAGKRTLRVTLDTDNRIDESDKTDNVALYDYDVLSTFLKAVDFRFGQPMGGVNSLKVLNPISDPGPISSVLFEFSRDESFSSPNGSAAPYGKTLSRLTSLPSGFQNGKVYWRARFNASDQRVAGPFSIWPADRPAAFVQKDSSDFSSGTLSNLRYDGSGLTTLPAIRKLRVISAGWFDGNFGIVEVDGINVLPATFFRSYSVVIFDSLTLKIKSIEVFDLYGNGDHRTAMKNHLDTVKQGEVVAIATADEPRSGSGTISESVSALGGQLLTTVQRNGSWSLIGHKGAAPGTVPEALTKPGEGKAVVEKEYSVVPDTGWIESPLIGPSAGWKSLTLQRSPTNTTRIDVRVSGIDGNGNAAPLLSIENAETIDLSSIDAAQYPYIQLRAVLIPDIGSTPVLQSWSVDFTLMPELALNYQSVFVASDTVMQGTDVEATIGILNAGESPSGQFPVHVDIVGPDNVRQPVANYQAGPLARDTWDERNVKINTSLLAGAYKVIVTVDRDDSIEEQYETNNSSVTAFHVLTDTTRPQLDVLIDGLTPVNGDFVRPTPDVTMTLIDSSPLHVTSPDNFTLSLNDTTIAGTDSRVQFVPAANGVNAQITFRPELTGGDHIFKFNVTDASGNKALTEPLEVLVRVEFESSLREVFNFPNPFTDASTFTFILTGTQTPQEMKLKIYTVSGKLIRTLTVPPTDLRIGYNTVKWDGRDEEGDELANGVYFYKIILKGADKSVEHIGRIAKLK